MNGRTDLVMFDGIMDAVLSVVCANLEGGADTICPKALSWG